MSYKYQAEFASDLVDLWNEGKLNLVRMMLRQLPVAQAIFITAQIVVQLQDCEQVGEAEEGAANTFIDFIHPNN